MVKYGKLGHGFNTLLIFVDMSVCAWIKITLLSCWPPRGKQASYQRWIWEVRCNRLHIMQAKRPTLALKPYKRITWIPWFRWERNSSMTRKRLKLSFLLSKFSEFLHKKTTGKFVNGNPEIKWDIPWYHDYVLCWRISSSFHCCLVFHQ